MPTELLDLINANVPASTPDESQEINAEGLNEVLVAVNTAIDDGGAGSSLPTGGTSGQVLAKASDDNGDVEWVDQTGGGGSTEEITFVAAVPMSRQNTIMSKALTANLTLTENTTGKSAGNGGTIRIQQDSTTAYTVTFPVDWIELAASEGISATLGMKHQVLYYYNGADVVYSVSQLGAAAIPDTTPPELSSIAVEDATPDVVDFTFDEALAAGHVPLASDFTVSGHTTTGTVTIDGLVVHVPVTVAFTNGEAARTGAYTPGLTANKLQDADGNLVVAFSGETIDNNVGAAPVQLNPPVLTAGTPTADGCPFTFTDTNTSPAESSGLIQITTTADTGYAAVVTTRTPAANTTSVASGTGLTASTGYRARMKWLGNGTSTLDSAYSSEVTFTTAAAAGRAPVIFTTVDDIETTTPSTTWKAGAGGNAGYGNTGIATSQVTGAGNIYMEVVGATSAIMGLTASTSMIGYASMEVAFGVTSTGDALPIDAGTPGSNITITGATGLRVSKTGSGPYVYKMQKTSDYVSWTDIYTFAATSDLTHIVADISGTSFNGRLVNPEFD